MECTCFQIYLCDVRTKGRNEVSQLESELKRNLCQTSTSLNLPVVLQSPQHISLQAPSSSRPSPVSRRRVALSSPPVGRQTNTSFPLDKVLNGQFLLAAPKGQITKLLKSSEERLLHHRFFISRHSYVHSSASTHTCARNQRAANERKRVVPR